MALFTRFLGAVLATALFAVGDTLEVERTADDVITDTWEVRYATTAHQHDGMLLEIVTFTTDVSPDLLTVGQANAGDLAEGRVWLLWRLSGDFDTDAALERSILVVITGLQRIMNRQQSWRLRLGTRDFARLTHQLVNCWH